MKEVKKQNMRDCIIGPCTLAEKEIIRGLLEESGEIVEPAIMWNCLEDVYMSICYFEDSEDWGTCGDGNNISYKSFINAYFPSKAEPKKYRLPEFFRSTFNGRMAPLGYYLVEFLYWVICGNEFYRNYRRFYKRKK